jgi:ketosteroid isomerase-like protein
MKSTFVAAALAAALMMASAAHCQTAAVDTKADFEVLATDWLSAYNQKDVSKIGNMYSEQAVVSLAPWTASGRQAIEEHLKQDIAHEAPYRMTSITVDQSRRMGELNYASGTWAAELKQDGKDVPVGGHWLIVAQYRDGKYQFLIHNSNMALPPPPSK